MNSAGQLGYNNDQKRDSEVIMITFTTQIPIQFQRSILEMIDVAKSWIAGSPHTELLKSDLEKPLVDDLLEVSYKEESVKIICANADQMQIGGMRYIKNERKLRWITDIVGTKSANEFWVSIQVSCDKPLPAQSLPAAKKPVIVKQIFEKLGVDADGGMATQNKAYYMKETELGLAEEVINYTLGNVLPVVYISAMSDDTTYVSAHILAEQLAGMAHVIVEPSKKFSQKLMKKVFFQNVYGGAVGIYWPEGTGRTKYIPGAHFETPQEMEEEIIVTIRDALNNQRLPKERTWANLEEIRSREMINKLKKEGSSLDDFITAFDSEAKAKDELLATAEKEIARLTEELGNTRKRQSNMALVPGNERDLYPGERKDIVVEALNAFMGQVRTDTRRYHILQDLLAFNKADGGAEEIASQLRNILHAYESLDARTRSGLEQLGFIITADGKHYKAVFKNDRRYVFSFSRTPGDHRAGKNLASDIIKKLFS